MEDMSATLLNFGEKSKSFTRRVFESRELFPALLVIVVGSVSFGLGRLSVAPTDTASHTQLTSVAQGSTEARTAEPIEEDTATALLGMSEEEATAVSATSSGEKKYVASKNSDKYHLPWCSGAARIAEENKIWFGSKEEAAAAGYTPAANCKGI